MRVVNASLLIHLARVSLLDLLRMPGLDVPVVVPFIVFQKFLRGARHDSSVGLVEQAARRLLVSVPFSAKKDTNNPGSSGFTVGKNSRLMTILEHA